MSQANSIMVLGAGRLAYRLAEMLKENGLDVIPISSDKFKEIDETPVQESSMDYARNKLFESGINKASSVCIVDSEDAVNTYLLMAVMSVREDVPIFAAFFNNSLVSDLASKHKNLKIFNPADIVGKLFVRSIPEEMSRKDEVKTIKTYDDAPRDSLIFWLLAGFAWLMISGAWFFRATEGVDWLRGFYLTATIITSVNFNDAELVNSDWRIKILLVGLMIATYAYTIMVLTFVFDYILRRRIDILTLGRRRYNMRGHVIVCGLGRVGYAIVKQLLSKGEKVIVIESDQSNIYLPAIRAEKISVMIGDATMAHYLIDAGIGRAKALICDIDSDGVNLEIGRNARAKNKHIRLLLRISDQGTAEEIKKRFNINYVFSKSFTTARVICDQIDWMMAERSIVTQN